MKRIWNVKLTIVDTAKKNSLLHNECYSKSRIESFVRNNLSDFDAPNAKIKNVKAIEVKEGK